MTQIKIEVPANDHIALSAMAEALQRIAAERAPQELTLPEMGNSQPNVTSVVKSEIEQRSNLGIHTDKAFDELKPTLNEQDLAEFKASIHHENTKHDEAFEEAVDSTLDADGIPHDKRIHSKGATRLADNTWRLRKRPADKTEEEWTTYIDSVKAELKAVQDIPSVEPEKLNAIDVAISDEKLEEGSVLDVAKKTLEASLDEQAVADLTPPVTLTEEQVREEIKEKLESGEVTVEAPLTPPAIEESATQLEGVTPNGDVAIEPPVTTVGAPVAPVTPPTSLTPPVVEAGKPSDQPSVTTFQELMLYMTSDAKKRGADNDMIKATLLEVDPALTAIPLIATRADLIPKFVEALEAKLS